MRKCTYLMTTLHMFSFNLTFGDFITAQEDCIDFVNLSLTIYYKYSLAQSSLRTCHHLKLKLCVPSSAYINTVMLKTIKGKRCFSQYNKNVTISTNGLKQRCHCQDWKKRSNTVVNCAAFAQIIGAFRHYLITVESLWPVLL